MPVQDPKFDMKVGRTDDFERPRKRGADTQRKMCVSGRVARTRGEKWWAKSPRPVRRKLKKTKHTVFQT